MTLIRTFRPGLAATLLVALPACGTRVDSTHEAPRATRATTPGAGAAAGDWRGRVVFRDAPLDVGIHLGGAGDSSTFSAPAIVLLDQPLADVRSGGGDVHFVSSDADGPMAFDGTLRGDTIEGSAALPARVAERQGAPTMTFRLVRAPRPPAPPYATRALTVKRERVSLAGTLVVPHGASRKARVPGLLIMAGSSTNLRSDYRFFADHFARAGFAVLLFDKRGNGTSTGNYDRATYDDLTADAEAAFDALARQPEVDAAHSGVWGLSQGAFLAPRVAAERAAFVVAVSAPGMPITVTAAYQDSVRVAWAHRPVDDARAAANANRALGNALYEGASRVTLDSLLARTASAPWRSLTSLPAKAPTDDRTLDGWYWRGRTIDPTPWWQELQVPALLIYGEADELVPSDTSARLIRRAVARGLNPDVTFRVYTGANHVLRLATSPLAPAGDWHWPTPAPGAMEMMTEWMRRHAGLTRAAGDGR